MYYTGALIGSTLASGSLVVSKAAATGNVYMILVSQYISRFQYSMGVESATIPTAPLNTPFPLSLPTPFGMQTQLYKFSIADESIVRMNYTSYAGSTIAADISMFAPTGIVYTTDYHNFGSGYFRSGLAESNYLQSLYMGSGNYLVSFTSGGTSSANVEINTYPITNYTSTATFDMGVHTTKVFAVNIASPFEYQAFNVTLLSQLNASMVYQMSLFDDYNNYLSAYLGDGSAAANPGIGNVHTYGAWRGVRTAQNYTDPNAFGQRYFSGNQSLQKVTFVPTYAGRYFLILDFLNGFNTTWAGTSNALRWRFYPNLTVSLKLDISKPDLGTLSPSPRDVTYLTLDSSSGSGSTGVTLTSYPSGITTRMIGLKLTPKINTWTRITVTITNGTVGTTSNATPRSTTFYEKLFDRLRYGVNTFNPNNALTPQIWHDNTYHMVRGTSSPRNVTYIIEFGAYQPMMVRFMVAGYFSPPGVGTAAHTVVSISVSHFDTPVISGLTPATGAAPAGPSGAPFPLEIALIVVAVVAVALVVAFVVVKKRSGSSRSRS
jgi:hypothetical protein